MKDLIKPNYKGLNIVNLMSSISNNFGKKHKYVQHKLLKASELKKYDNVVLLVVDGLGFNYLSKQKHSFLNKNLRGSFTSTFLSTTACANTSYFVGYPAQQHGVMAWDVFFKEVGGIVSFLRFSPKFGFNNLEEHGFKITDLFNIDSFHKGLKADSFTILDKKISDSIFTKYASKHSKIISVNSLANNLNKLSSLLSKKSKKRRFFHSYISDFDSSSHDHGVNSKKTLSVFNEIDKKVMNFYKKVKNTNTVVLVVSDHGFIDTTKKSRLEVSKFKGLNDCLSIPLWGDPRVGFCFVRNNKIKDFEKIVKQDLSKYAYVFKSEDLLKKGFYGLGKPTKKLVERIGDYTIIMKENYVLEDFLANKDKTSFLIGQHGGLSEDEMRIPLIVLK